MHAVEATTMRTEEHQLEQDWDHAFADVLEGLGRRGHGAATTEVGTRLRCVSGGYLADQCSCEASVPLEVVSVAWNRQLEGGGEEGFFRFAWQEQVWLGYGLKGGRVRGVYCPAHSVERDQRLQSARTAAQSPTPRA
jgi:hypothetical protein